MSLVRRVKKQLGTLHLVGPIIPAIERRRLGLRTAV